MDVKNTRGDRAANADEIVEAGPPMSRNRPAECKPSCEALLFNSLNISVSIRAMSRKRN